MDIAKIKNHLLAKKWVRVLSSLTAGTISAIAVFLAVVFSLIALTRVFLRWSTEPGEEFWVPFGTALLCGILVGLTVALAGLKEGRSRDLLRKCKAFFQWWAKFRFIRWSFRISIACAFWAFFLFGLVYIFEELHLAREYNRKLELGIAVLWINIPIFWTMYRSFKRTEKEWDWWFITLLIVYSNLVLVVFFSQTTIESHRDVWIPDVHFLRGQWYGIAFTCVVLTIGFFIRLFKRMIPLPMFFYYGIGLVLPLFLIPLLYSNKV